MSGKGDKQRPRYITDHELALRHELIFGKPEDKPEILAQIERLKNSANSLNKESKL